MYLRVCVCVPLFTVIGFVQNIVSHVYMSFGRGGIFFCFFCFFCFLGAGNMERNRGHGLSRVLGLPYRVYFSALVFCFFVLIQIPCTHVYMLWVEVRQP